MTSGAIGLQREGAVATVLIDNPDKLNALTVAMWQQLAVVMQQVSADDAVRCVVLRGAGEQAFAAGADIAEFATLRNNAAQGEVYHREWVYGALRAVGDCRHPTVAMIYGPCVGGGLELACQCDLRIAATSARFGVPINRLGFAIAYDELAAVLPLVGRAVALALDSYKLPH
jgi:enoyl-CoA hydratase/carnithine racemase